MLEIFFCLYFYKFSDFRSTKKRTFFSLTYVVKFSTYILGLITEE